MPMTEEEIKALQDKLEATEKALEEAKKKADAPTSNPPVGNESPPKPKVDPDIAKTIGELKADVEAIKKTLGVAMGSGRKGYFGMGG